MDIVEYPGNSLAGRVVTDPANVEKAVEPFHRRRVDPVTGDGDERLPDRPPNVTGGSHDRLPLQRFLDDPFEVGSCVKNHLLNFVRGREPQTGRFPPVLSHEAGHELEEGFRHDVRHGTNAPDDVLDRVVVELFLREQRFPAVDGVLLLVQSNSLQASNGLHLPFDG